MSHKSRLYPSSFCISTIYLLTVRCVCVSIGQSHKPSEWMTHSYPFSAAYREKCFIYWLCDRSNHVPQLISPCPVYDDLPLWGCESRRCTGDVMGLTSTWVQCSWALTHQLAFYSVVYQIPSLPFEGIPVIGSPCLRLSLPNHYPSFWATLILL